jgi:hypothetical protein
MCRPHFSLLPIHDAFQQLTLWLEPYTKLNKTHEVLANGAGKRPHGHCSRQDAEARSVSQDTLKLLYTARLICQPLFAVIFTDIIPESWDSVPPSQAAHCCYASGRHPLDCANSPDCPISIHPPLGLLIPTGSFRTMAAAFSPLSMAP